MSSSNSRIEALNSLRFFMCMIVVVAHMEFLGGEGTPNFFNYYLQNAAVAVDYFFVLSGFGLTLSAIRSPERLPKDYSLGKAFGYAFGRVNKLYKVYLVTMLLAIPADFLEKIFRGQSILSAIAKTGVNVLIAPTLLQSASGLLAVSHSLNGVAWFLSCLFILYMVYPLLEKVNEIIRSRHLVAIAIPVTLGFTCFIHKLFTGMENNFSPLGFTLDLSHGSPYMRVFHLFLGMLIADVVSQKKKSITGLKATVLEIVALIIGLCSTVLGNRVFYGELGEIKNFIYLISAMLVVYVFAVCRGTVSAFLENKLLLLLGSVSMYVFLIHYVVRQTIGIILYEFIEPVWWVNALVVITILGVTFGATYYCYRKSSNKK